MKNILVPTDFSIYAKYATEAALELAKKFGSTVYLMTCLNIPQFDIMSLSENEKVKFREAIQTIHNTEKLFKEWETRADLEGIELKTSWEAGYLPLVISKIQKENKIDCIVMGSHGVGENLQSVLGSNTQKVIRKTDCPVFVIKSPLQKINFKSVVFASGFDSSEKEGFEYFLEFIRPFQPDVIHLLKIDTSVFFHKSYEFTIEMLEEFRKSATAIATAKSHFYRDYTVDAGVRHFTDDINADLIIISNHRRRPFKRTWIGSNVEDLIRATELPLISFDYSYINTRTQTKYILS